MRITERVESTWHYHLSHDNDFTRSLCGRRTMQTSLRLEQWDHTPRNYHIPERWCAECARLAGVESGVARRESD